MDEIIEQFVTNSDRGRTVTVFLIQEYVPAGNMNDPHARLAGLKRYETEDARALNRIDDNHFEVVSTGEMLTRV